MRSPKMSASSMWWVDKMMVRPEESRKEYECSLSFSLTEAKTTWCIIPRGTCLFMKSEETTGAYVQWNQYQDPPRHVRHLSSKFWIHCVFYSCLSARQQSGLEMTMWAWIWDKIKKDDKGHSKQVWQGFDGGFNVIPLIQEVSCANCNNYSTKWRIIHRCSNSFFSFFFIMLYRITHNNYHTPQKAGKKTARSIMKSQRGLKPVWKRCHRGLDYVWSRHLLKGVWRGI